MNFWNETQKLSNMVSFLVTIESFNKAFGHLIPSPLATVRVLISY